MFNLSRPRGDSSSTPAPAEEWPPVWKPIEKSPQFIYGMISRYLHELPCNPLADSEFPISSNSWVVKDGHEKLMRFLQQVRASRGYDVDVIPPEVFQSPFCPVPLSHYSMWDTWADRLRAKVNFVVSEMNSQAQQHGELDRFEFHEVKKVVEARPHRCTLITFTIKVVARRPVVKTVQAMVYTPARCDFELEEWRFKPQDHGDGDGDGGGGGGGGDESGSGYGYEYGNYGGSGSGSGSGSGYRYDGGSGDGGRDSLGWSW